MILGHFIFYLLKGDYMGLFLLNTTSLTTAL